MLLREVLNTYLVMCKQQQTQLSSCVYFVLCYWRVVNSVMYIQRKKLFGSNDIIVFHVVTFLLLSDMHVQ